MPPLRIDASLLSAQCLVEAWSDQARRCCDTLLVLAIASVYYNESC